MNAVTEQLSGLPAPARQGSGGAIVRLPLRDSSLVRQAALINGRWIEPGERLPVFNPSTRELLGGVPSLDELHIVEAIAAAERAFRLWRRTSVSERAQILRTLAAAMLDNIDDLGAILTAEQGKPLEEAKGEIRYAAGFVQWFAEECRRSYGEVIPTPWPDRRLHTTREPIGVVAAITPWNFPSAMITRKVVPAIAAGCAVVLKPAEQTPFSAMAIAVLAERAGLPPGVLNIVTGEPAMIGSVLCASPVVRMLTFTGSTQVGRILAQQCAPTIKRLGLELGGNAPFIVFDDADLDAAVEGAIASKYRNSGQTCVCTNRFLVQSGIHDRFVERLAEASAALKVGDGFEEGVQQGPLISEAAAVRLRGLIDEAVGAGARVARPVRPLEGQFFAPTVLLGVRPEMAVARQELFGPVSPVIQFDTEEDAIALANDTEYGLSAYVYTRDTGRSWRMSEALEYGIVGINTGIVSTEVAPFGGVKQSGLGREGGRAGLEEFTEIKYVCTGGI